MSPEIVIERLQCYLRWNAARIDALDEDHEPIADPACFTRGKGNRLEYWITAATWRDVIFTDDYEAEAPRILCDAGLLRPLDHANLQVCAKIRGKVTKVYALRAEVVSFKVTSETPGGHGGNGHARLGVADNRTAAVFRARETSLTFPELRLPTALCAACLRQRLNG